MKNNTLVKAGVYLILILFALVLIIPGSREIFKALSSTHPYAMGFIKFGLLATVGECIGLRLRSGMWNAPAKLIHRVLIWGCIGVSITLMMKLFSFGSAALAQNGLLPGKDIKLVTAFYAAAFMNIAFGPTFMAFHKCTDAWLALKAKDNGAHSLKEIIHSVNWVDFVSFTIFKTIPFFWIPAHTVTFLLPAEYQVIVAAMLSVVLGIILSIPKKNA